jgi:hypothetical protein
MAGHRMSLHVTLGWSRCPAPEPVVVRQRPDRCILIMAMQPSESPFTRRGIGLPQHEVRHNVLRGLDRVSAVGSLAAGGFRSLEEWGHVVPRDHLADEHRRGQQRSIDRCGSPSSTPRGVALHTRSQPVGSGDPARTRTWPLPAHASARGRPPADRVGVRITASTPPNCVGGLGPPRPGHRPRYPTPSLGPTSSTIPTPSCPGISGSLGLTGHPPRSVDVDGAQPGRLHPQSVGGQGLLQVLQVLQIVLAQRPVVHQVARAGAQRRALRRSHGCG